VNRRELIRLGLASSSLALAGKTMGQDNAASPHEEAPAVNLMFDGRPLSPTQYAALLSDLAERNDAGADMYGTGGAVKALEDEIAQRTGKEAALFLPTGTMANQLALKVLSGDRSKIFVQDQSHVFRDESDAAQTVHGKRLVPLAPGAGNFTLEELEAAIAHYRRNEVFETGIGAISIENTVRRRFEEIFDIREIARISEYARANGIGMHLDGARLYVASTWSGVSVREYSSHFDTVYISMYKCFNAGAGAVLAGPETLIMQVAHWMKVYGGTMLHNWHNAMVARHFLQSYEDTQGAVKATAEQLFSGIDEIEQLSIERIESGSNVVKLHVEGADVEVFRKTLNETYNVHIRPPIEQGFIPVKVNETLLDAPVATIIDAFKASLAVSMA